MKKLSIILLAVLLTVSLFVSCDNTTKAVTDEHVAVTFSTGADSRSLSYAIEDVSNLQWFYTARKANQDDPFKYGQTGDLGKPITLGSEIEFSQGLWNFVLWAEKGAIVEDGSVTSHGTKVYQGSPDSSVLIKKDTNPQNIIINVSPVIPGEIGSIQLNKITITLRDTESESTQTVYANKAVIKGKGISNTGEEISIDGDDISIDPDTHIGTKTVLPGDYDVTVMYKESVSGEGQSQELTYASETITVTVWSGRTTTVSGKLSELTGSAIINGNIRVPSIATIQKTVSESAEPTVFSANVAPSNNAQSTTLDKTTVAFESGALEEEETYKLSVEVSNDVENGNINIDSTSGIAATLNLSLKKGETDVTNFNEKTVTITTYIAKGLRNVKVYYGDSEITGSTYDPLTGKLVFKTDHFSEYKVIVDGGVSYEAYNATTKKAYESFIAAINELATNDVLYLIKNVVYNYATDLIATDNSNPNGTGPVIKVACTIDGMGHEIKNTISGLESDSRLLSIFNISSGTVEIKNLSLVSGTYSTYFRGISLSNNHNMTIKLDNVTINIPDYYAFNIFTDCDGTNIVMNDCDISGWNTIYNHASNITLNATNCYFDTTNPSAGGGSSNSFSNVIVAEYYDEEALSKNNVFTFSGCTFTAAKDFTNSNVTQVVCDVRSPNFNTVNFNNCTFTKLSSPQYLMLAIDTVSEDDLDTRRGMLRKSHIYIDGEEITEGNEILNSYIDWEFSESTEDGIMDLCNNTYIINPIPYMDGEVVSSPDEYTCTVKMENFPNNQYTFSSKLQGDGTWKLSCQVQKIVSTEEQLKRAIGNGKKGQTIIFDNDISLTYGGDNANGTHDTYVMVENAVIDLNGHTLTVNSNDKFMLAKDNQTIKNGHIQAGPDSSLTSGKISYALGTTAGSKNVTIEDISIDGGMEALGPSTVTFRNVTSTATNFYNIYLAGGATANIEGGNYTSAIDKPHFYTDGTNNTVIVTSGTFSGGTPTHNGNGTFTNNINNN